MKILFLDDNINRCEYARERFKGQDYFEANTTDEAIAILKAQSRFDLVYLDHDLGGKTFVPSNEESGYWVAKFISEMPFSKRPYKVVVHTYNPAGARNMMDVLKDTVPELQYEPFAVVQ